MLFSSRWGGKLIQKHQHAVATAGLIEYKQRHVGFRQRAERQLESEQPEDEREQEQS